MGEVLQDTTFEQFRIISRKPGIVVAQVEQVCVAIWRNEVTKERFQCQRDGLRTVVNEFPGTAAFLCVVEEGVPPPSRRMRRASIEMVDEQRGHLRCVAGVCEGEGMIVTIARTVMLWFMQLINRSNVPMEFFPSIRAAHEWLSKQTSVGSLDSFERTVALVRTQLDVAALRSRVDNETNRIASRDESYLSSEIGGSSRPVTRP